MKTKSKRGGGGVDNDHEPPLLALMKVYRSHQVGRNGLLSHNFFSLYWWSSARASLQKTKTCHDIVGRNCIKITFSAGA